MKKLFSLLIACVGLFSLSTAQNQLCLLSTHRYYYVVNLSNGGSALSNYQMRLVVNTSTPVAQSKMMSNGNDIRFTDQNCNNIPYYIESGMNTGSTVIWVKVASVPAGASKIYMYYGNSGSSAASDAASVFDFWDDFTGSTLSASWNQYKTGSNTITVSGGNVNFNSTISGGDATIRTVSTFNTPSLMEMNVTSASGSWPSIAQLSNSSFNGAALFNGGTMYCGQASPSCIGYQAYFNSSASPGTLTGVWSIAYTGSTSAVGTWPGGSLFPVLSPATAYPSTVHGALGALCSGSGTMSADWFRVRRYAAVVPTSSVSGESPNYNLDISGLLDQYGNAVTNFCGTEWMIAKMNIRGNYSLGSLYFQVQLSDASGSFSSPVTLGSVSGGAGTFDLIDYYMGYFPIPNNLPYGTGYRIRAIQVTPGNPVFNGASSPAFTIGARPTSTNYSINNAAQCNETDNFTFTASGTIATGNTRAFKWDFGDTTTGTGSPVSHGYVWHGTKNVKMVVYNQSLPRCADSITKSVIVHPQPYASIGYNPSDCQQNDHVFLSWGSGVAAGNWLTTDYWDFGDGQNTTTSAGSWVTHKYSAYGTYTVRLIVTSNNGCKDTASQTHYAYPQPKASFTHDLACDGRDVQFNDQTSLVNFQNSTIGSYYWQFGDAGQHSDKNPKHLYSSVGTYNVKLTVYSNYNCWDTFRKLVVVNPTPKASFTADPSCVNAVVPIKNLSSISAGTMTYKWNMGNGTTSNLAVPTPTYSPSGNYTIKLYATANTGCVDSTQKDIIIHGLPTAQFSATSVCNGNVTDFTNYSVGASTYKWTFESGATSTTKDPQYTFGSEGTWPVKLVAATAFGCKDSVTNDVDVWEVPKASFSVNNLNQCLRGNNFLFTNNSSIGTGSIINQWAFGDGTVSTDLNPTKKYAAAGSFGPSLTVTSDKGCVASAATNLQVFHMPKADFSFSNSCAGASVPFTNLSSISAGTMNHSWAFGDGNVSSATSPSNTYAAAGNYNVRLIANSNNGCRDTITKVYTAWPNPTVNFTATAVCNGLPTQFTNASSVVSGFMAGYTWNFGDATTGNEINPQHVYASHGTYNVSLTGVTDKGCSANASKSVDVWPQPKASYTATNVCLGKQTQFTSTSSIPAGSISTFDWTFGDASTGSGASIGHTYAAFGRYATSLKVTSDKGCVSSASKDVDVYRQPDARIWSSTTKTSVLNPVVDFADNSLYGDLSNWDFGFRGRTSTMRNDTASYTKPGTFKVKLVSTSSEGCTDSDSININVENGYTMYFPTAFTPNGDNLNDGFGPVGIFEGIKAFQLKVLDNRGRVIFSTTDARVKWNGKIENTGETMEAGTYAWFAEYTDYKDTKRKENGHITIRK